MSRRGAHREDDLRERTQTDSRKKVGSHDRTTDDIYRPRRSLSVESIQNRNFLARAASGGLVNQEKIKNKKKEKFGTTESKLISQLPEKVHWSHRSKTCSCAAVTSNSTSSSSLTAAALSSVFESLSNESNEMKSVKSCDRRSATAS